MRGARWLTAAVLCSAAPAARAETRGALTFGPIAGWQRSEAPGAVVLERGGARWARAVVFDTRASRGSVEADFAAAWQAEAVALGAGAPLAPVVNTHVSGWRVALSGAAVDQRGAPATLLLVVYSDGRRAVPILYLSNDPALQPPFNEWLGRLALPPPASAAAPPAPAPAAPPVAAEHRETPWEQAARAPKRRGSAQWRGGPLAGIWMGFRNSAQFERSVVDRDLHLQLSKTSPTWLTFLADGTFYEGMVRAGFWALDPAEEARLDPDNARFWGSWRVEGDRVHLKARSGRTLDYTLGQDLLDEDPRTTGHTRFHRARSVDGLTLDGTWSTWQRWDEASRAPHWAGSPVIRFWRDGRFEDRGAFLHTLIDPIASCPPYRRPGRGTYRVEGFALMLRYDDGRDVHHTLTPPMKGDLLANDKVLFVGQFPFYRQD